MLRQLSQRPGYPSEMYNVILKVSCYVCKCLPSWVKKQKKISCVSFFSIFAYIWVYLYERGCMHMCAYTWQYVSYQIFHIFYKVYLNSEGAACSYVMSCRSVSSILHLCVKQRVAGVGERDMACRSRRRGPVRVRCGRKGGADVRGLSSRWGKDGRRGRVELRGLVGWRRWRSPTARHTDTHRTR